ncbi:hypothetical protein IMX26_11895 [Clostridium sp. 'deep sea']|uniref:hypothetical protein n=1 Tax=Clostridium sp. 'deep sea' TaxID=2779445 RepID=UPI0018967E60|nr:hypothetical protein [Clostridium sp. 'deep sea']QOR34190.1 hypothetical protein IMX26_11895 [Clostridium sp. 'deep sea']
MYKILIIIFFGVLAYKELTPLLIDKLYKDAGVTAGLIVIGIVIAMFAAFHYRVPILFE